jgi:hypothetical protein
MTGGGITKCRDPRLTPIERAVLWELMCRPIVGNGELIEAL